MSPIFIHSRRGPSESEIQEAACKRTGCKCYCHEASDFSLAGFLIALIFIFLIIGSLVGLIGGIMDADYRNYCKEENRSRIETIFKTYNPSYHLGCYLGGKPEKE